MECLDQDGSNSPLDVTPARANTPTSAPRTSDSHRHPLIGASLATSLARISSSRPDTRDSRRGNSNSPERKSPSRLSGLYPDESDSSCFRRNGFTGAREIKHMGDLDMLQELKASMRNQMAIVNTPKFVKTKTVNSSGSLPSTPPQALTKKLIAPIGVMSNDETYESTSDQQTDPQASVLSRVNSKLLDGVVGHQRPMHHSLPARLTIPLAPPPTALSEHGRKNSRVVLTPLDDNRKVSAP